MTNVAEKMQQQAEEFRTRYKAVRDEIGKVIVGHDEIVHGVLTSMFVGGHCLLEGVPGLGKTMLVRTLSDALNLHFSRIQFTPDLMPADILGTNMIVENEQGRKALSFKKGRSLRRSAWRTRLIAPLPRRNQRCWKRCRRGLSR